MHESITDTLIGLNPPQRRASTWVASAVERPVRRTVTVADVWVIRASAPTLHGRVQRQAEFAGNVMFGGGTRWR
jgi:hypothetical protein